MCLPWPPTATCNRASKQPCQPPKSAEYHTSALPGARSASPKPLNPYTLNLDARAFSPYLGRWASPCRSPSAVRRPTRWTPTCSTLPMVRPRGGSTGCVADPCLADVDVGQAPALASAHA
eukprot:362462-Chlamydomonas_euryale.AAC.2